MDLKNLSKITDSVESKNSVSDEFDVILFKDLDEPRRTKLSKEDAKTVTDQLAGKTSNSKEIFIVKAGDNTAEELFEDDFIVGGFEQWVEPVTYKGEEYFAFDWGL